MVYQGTNGNLLDAERQRLEAEYGGRWQYYVAGGCFKRLPEPKCDGEPVQQGKDKGFYNSRRAWTLVPDSAFTDAAMAIIKRQREEVALAMAERTAATAKVK